MAVRQIERDRRGVDRNAFAWIGRGDQKEVRVQVQVGYPACWDAPAGVELQACLSCSCIININAPPIFECYSTTRSILNLCNPDMVYVPLPR